MAHEQINHRQNEGTDTPRAELASTSKKSNRGFASMDRSKQREIASKGGRAAHEKGTAHQFTPDEARQAGRKGGGAVSQDRQHMAEIGRIGGQARGRKQKAKAEAESQPEIESSPDSESERTSHH
jgi:general stress protein YciG